MIAYKLFREMKNGTISPLFINKKSRLPINTILTAEEHPTKGFAIRKGWHCTSQPIAPHISTKNRAWYLVDIQDFTEITRPLSQGGKWYIADKMTILHKL